MWELDFAVFRDGFYRKSEVFDPQEDDVWILLRRGGANRASQWFLVILLNVYIGRTG